MLRLAESAVEIFQVGGIQVSGIPAQKEVELGLLFQFLGNGGGIGQ